jgi:hypothetical protein
LKDALRGFNVNEDVNPKLGSNSDSRGSVGNVEASTSSIMMALVCGISSDWNNM